MIPLHELMPFQQGFQVLNTHYPNYKHITCTHTSYILEMTGYHVLNNLWMQSKWSYHILTI